MLVTPIMTVDSEGGELGLALGRIYEVLGLEADMYRLLAHEDEARCSARTRPSASARKCADAGSRASVTLRGAAATPSSPLRTTPALPGSSATVSAADEPATVCARTSSAPRMRDSAASGKDTRTGAPTVEPGDTLATATPSFTVNDDAGAP